MVPRGSVVMGSIHHIDGHIETGQTGGQGGRGFPGPTRSLILGATGSMAGPVAMEPRDPVTMSRDHRGHAAPDP